MVTSVVFKHNISGDHPKVPNVMPNPLPPEFFVNPGYLLVQAAVEATTIEAPPSKTAKEPMEAANVEDQSRL